MVKREGASFAAILRNESSIHQLRVTEMEGTVT